MAQIPHLDNAAINLTSLREQSQKELITILKNIRGKKCLVIDPKLGGSISLIVQTSVLKENGVELRHLSADPLQTECSKVVYLVRNQLDLMWHISSNIQNDISKGLQREYFVYFVPRRSVACEKILDEQKVHHLLTIGEFPLYMVPLDDDILSFELDLAYKEYLVDGDASLLWHIAKAIHKLESSIGVIPNVRAKGKGAARVADILNRMQAEEPVNTSDAGVPEIQTLILLDREVDMVTPMLSQLTYEGLIDELLHVNNGAVELDASIMGVQQEGKKIKVPLNSSDKLFKEIRDLNFEVVVQVLRQKATSMKQDYTDITTMSQTVSELKDFVKKLNSLPEMTRHINLAQHLSKFTSKPSFLGRLDMEHTIVESESYDISTQPPNEATTTYQQDIIISNHGEEAVVRREGSVRWRNRPDGEGGRWICPAWRSISQTRRSADLPDVEEHQPDEGEVGGSARRGGASVRRGRDRLICPTWRSISPTRGRSADLLDVEHQPGEEQVGRSARRGGALARRNGAAR
ncbi:Vacuolar protein-sorting-associated protein 33 [Dionaea muscipula]